MRSLLRIFLERTLCQRGLWVSMTLFPLFSGCSGEVDSRLTPKGNDSNSVAGKGNEQDLFVVSSSESPSEIPSPREIPRTTVDSPRFDDVALNSGIEFSYDNGASPRRLMVEATGGGAGWLDVDRDSYLDLYLVQGGSPLLN